MRVLRIFLPVIAALIVSGTASGSPISTAGAQLRHMQLVMGTRTTPQPATWTQLRVHPKVVYREQRNVLGSYYHTKHVYAHPPHKSGWLCIHRYEGAWNDSGAPYYGGLQMDLGFQGTYGPYLLRTKGPANNWTPLEQMWTAERAFGSGRGYYPWPNTARYCGLI